MVKVPKIRRPKKHNIANASDEKQATHLKKLRKQLIAGLALSLIGIAVIVAALLWPQTKSRISADPMASSAPVVDTCSGSNKTPTYSCYKKELTDVTNQYGPEKAAAIVKASYSKVPYVKDECHQLMHTIGRAALAKYHNDIAQTYAHGDQFCWSGYYHGAMEELATIKGWDFIVKNANSICAPIAKSGGRYSFYDYNCLHGMGHGFMFIKNGDLFASLSACDSLSDSWDRNSCYGGVFMQNIMNEQTPDDDARIGSKYLKADQPMYPCTAVDQKYKDQCYLMQTSYALQTVNYDFNKVFTMCAGVDSQFVDTCYTSLGRDASGNSVSNADTTRKTCLLGPNEEAQRYCVHGAAMDFVSYFHSDVQAKQLCNSLPSNLSGDCLTVVKNYYATF